MLLALTHTLVSERLHDQAFLAKYCSGFERVLPYLMGETDGQPKDADWASPITGVPAETIRALARRMASRRTMGNENFPNVVLEMNEVVAAAAKFGLEVVPLKIKRTEDIAPGIESLKGRVDALYICTDPLLTTHRVRINTLAIAERLPTMLKQETRSG